MKSDEKTAIFLSSWDIGQAIKRRRNALGMSQEKLAELLNVTYQQVQRYENGSNKLNVENIQNVATALEVAPTYFFDPGNVIVSEADTPYFNREEQQLFRLFRSINNPVTRTLLIDVARLAAQKN